MGHQRPRRLSFTRASNDMKKTTLALVVTLALVGLVAMDAAEAQDGCASPP